MIRTAALSAASIFCLLVAAGCASTDGTGAKSAASAPAAKTADGELDTNADLATLAKTLPDTLDGEIRRAQLLRAKGDYDDAARALAQLMLIAPDDGRVVGEYGKVLEQQGQSRQALAFLKRAIELHPHDWTFHSALGVAYDQLDDHASARAAYERALALKPGEPSVLNNYAVSRMLAKDYATAERLFAQASQEGETNPKIERNLKKLAALEPKKAEPIVLAEPAVPPAPKPMPQVEPPARPVETAGAVKPHQDSQIVMQPVPATPRAIAHGAPRALVANAVKPSASKVVMERVPFDPLAGPVANANAKARVALTKPVLPVKPTVIAQKPPVVAQKPQSPTPSLRTAADAD